MKLKQTQVGQQQMNQKKEQIYAFSIEKLKEYSKERNYDIKHLKLYLSEEEECITDVGKECLTNVLLN